MMHTINIFIHVIAGSIALILGLFAIVFNSKVRTHRKLGKVFLLFFSIVVVSGFVGWLLFRSDPFLVMLTLLSGYVGFSGYRSVKLKTKRISIAEVTLAVGTLVTGVLYLMWLQESFVSWSPSVIYPTVFALALVTCYDIIKYFFLFRKLKDWWLYEHIYKILSAYGALLTAFSGNVLRGFQPYSQILPSVFINGLVIYFIFRRSRLRRKIITPDSANFPASDTASLSS